MNIANYTPIPHTHTETCMPRQGVPCHITTHLHHVACQLTKAELAKVHDCQGNTPIDMSEDTIGAEVEELPDTPSETVKDVVPEMWSDMETSDESEPIEIRTKPRIRLRKRELRHVL